MARLNYTDDTGSGLQPVVLKDPSGLRVECHLRTEEDGSATLLALSGRGDRVGKSKLQGPYETPAQAVAARKAIVAELVRMGFSLAPNEHPLWSMDAQRIIRQLRSVRANDSSRYKFDPKDVFLDW